MSVFMEAWKRVVPQERSREIPPREVTRGITAKAGLWPRVGEPGRQAMTWTSHFGYGTTMSMVYAATASRLPLPAAASGALFGLGVWAGSYAAWLPGLGILPPPQDKPRERIAMVVASHLVWGVTLGMVYRALANGRRADL
jgi:uncharacterized membrane protein YagU involved in acid resistance